ncbi:DUF6080 domain-containing protein [Elizabethkingia meningoseptica]|uniref:DUF6080 domain-containing protein n=1 Tax=Elizabethkingia meningoseptica TaxID=238 RepID=UPI0020115D22|nr:DUF6080 domain-containing protein [Elizabethkingia meningoseptica]MCL1675919.1 DUF6080 domain-containing protein [Elizabethkingia meningoseptica]
MKAKFFNFFKTIFPVTATELFVLLFFIAVYMSFGWFIASEFRLVYDERVPWDAYFSFDNYSIVNTGGGWERHPFSIYLFDVIRDIALYISGGKTDSTFRIVLMAFSATTVAFTMLQFYKYFRNIIKLPVAINLFLLLFFSFFTTPVLLSFTPETYTYSFFLLVFFNYFAALKLTQEKSIGIVPLTGFGILIGGLTITNIVKVYIPLLFEKDLFRKWKKTGLSVLKVLISIGVFTFLYLWRLDFNVRMIINQTSSQYERFSKPKVTPLWDMMTSWFWGGSMLFPSFITRDYESKAGFHYKALFMDVYSAWGPYIFVIIITGLVVWSFIANYKNKLVQILGLSLLCDIIIHCVMKFGLHTSYIYGGHFIFVVPMMLGWLFYSQKNKPKIISALWVILIMMFVYLGVNNVYRLNEVIQFAYRYYH